MIELKNVSKKFGTVKAVSEVSFLVEDGSIHGLIGENSAGKTTLIKMMTGILKMDEGSICYDKEPVYDHPAVLDKIGYIADVNDYISTYTVEGMCRFYERAFSGFLTDDFWDLALEFELPRNRRIGALSKGQKMRLAFALNLARHPKYLIMDEPTSGMDPAVKQKWYQHLIREVEEYETTVLISSHHLGELERICDNVTMMKQGKVYLNESVGTAKEAYHKLQIVFPDGMPENFANWQQVVGFSHIGSIYTVIVREYGKKFEEQLKKAGAQFIEELELSLEELFLIQNQRGEFYGEL